MMKLMEYEGKRLFREAGIPVPGGAVAQGGSEAGKITAETGFPAVVKAQVLSGGRGKRGGIKVVNSASEAEAIASTLLREGLTGEKVERVLIEQGVNIAREFYMAITVDAGIGAPVLMASAEGGVEIESVPEGKIAIKPINIFIGLQAFDVRAAVKGWGLEEPQVKEIIAIAAKLYDLYKSYDADLVEINPLGLTKEGSIVALDAKVIINDNALYRQHQFQKTRDRYDNDLEYRAAEHNLNYVKLDGNIGLLCTGAGLTLATLDLIIDNGGRAANFMESGGANYANTFHGLALVLSDPDVRVLLINTFGLVSRADVICRGLGDAIKELKPAIPIVASIRGTGEEEARRIFREELKIEPFHRMEDAVKEAIKLAR
jgi:succinyl-CoA synthetase beta subunit